MINSKTREFDPHSVGQHTYRTNLIVFVRAQRSVPTQLIMYSNDLAALSCECQHCLELSIHSCGDVKISEERVLVSGPNAFNHHIVVENYDAWQSLAQGLSGLPACFVKHPAHSFAWSVAPGSSPPQPCFTSHPNILFIRTGFFNLSDYSGVCCNYYEVRCSVIGFQNS